MSGEICEVIEQEFVALRIELAEHIVEQQDRRILRAAWQASDMHLAAPAVVLIRSQRRERFGPGRREMARDGDERRVCAIHGPSPLQRVGSPLSGLAVHDLLGHEQIAFKRRATGRRRWTSRAVSRGRTRAHADDVSGPSSHAAATAMPTRN